MKPAVAGATAVLFVAASWAAGVGGASPSPALTVQAFRDALHAGEGENAVALLAPEVVIFEAGGAEMSRDEYAEAHLPGDLEFSRAVRSELVDRQSAGIADAAWVLSRYRTRGEFRGKPIDSEETETIILRQTKDGWRIVHIHWSSHRLAP